MVVPSRPGKSFAAWKNVTICDTDEWRIFVMFKIVEKKSLNPTVSKITVEAPLIAKKAEPGQFIIVSMIIHLSTPGMFISQKAAIRC